MRYWYKTEPKPVEACSEGTKSDYPEEDAQNLENCCKVALTLEEPECTVPAGYVSYLYPPEEKPRTEPFVESTDNTAYENELGKKYTTRTACEDGEYFDEMTNDEYHNVMDCCYNMFVQKEFECKKKADKKRPQQPDQKPDEESGQEPLAFDLSDYEKTLDKKYASLKDCWTKEITDHMNKDEKDNAGRCCMNVFEGGEPKPCKSPSGKKLTERILKKKHN